MEAYYMSTARIRTFELRSMRHMTQSTLAEQAQLSKTTISNLESGSQTKIALDTIGKLCRALDCTPSDLFELNDQEQEKMLTHQKEALAPFIGSLEYTRPFDPAQLDADLAALTNTKKARRKK